MMTLFKERLEMAKIKARNDKIYAYYLKGVSIPNIARGFSLVEEQVKNIIRYIKSGTSNKREFKEYVHDAVCNGVNVETIMNEFMYAKKETITNMVLEIDIQREGRKPIEPTKVERSNQPVKVGRLNLTTRYVIPIIRISKNKCSVPNRMLTTTFMQDYWSRNAKRCVVEPYADITYIWISEVGQ